MNRQQQQPQPVIPDDLKARKSFLENHRGLLTFVAQKHCIEFSALSRAFYGAPGKKAAERRSLIAEELPKFIAERRAA